MQIALFSIEFHFKQWKYPSLKNWVLSINYVENILFKTSKKQLARSSEYFMRLFPTVKTIASYPSVDVIGKRRSISKFGWNKIKTVFSGECSTMKIKLAAQIAEFDIQREKKNFTANKQQPKNAKLTQLNRGARILLCSDRTFSGFILRPKTTENINYEKSLKLFIRFQSLFISKLKLLLAKKRSQEILIPIGKSKLIFSKAHPKSNS